MIFRPLWIEVNLKALRSNFKRIRRTLKKGTKIIAVVKQFAYGHGLAPLARELSFLGVDFFGVGSLEEAIFLRREGFKEPVIVLSAVAKKFADYFIRYKVRPVIVDLEFAARLNKEAQRSKVVVPAHLKVDTGMGRLGFDCRNADKLIRSLAKFENICLEGIYTHFPVADTGRNFTNAQITAFNQLIQRLKSEGIYFKFAHCANSAGIINYPHAHFNIVRPGLILYGIKPAAKITFKAEPVLSLKSKVIFVKRIAKGTGVSYAREYIAKKPTRIATVAAGYADGYPWGLSGNAKVIIKDSFFNLAGRVCMDHLMVDLKRRKDIKVGQEAILLGKKGNLEVSAEDLAAWAKTIPYEIVSRLSLSIPRVYKFSAAENGTKKDGFTKINH